jgi:hypothetical protein
LRRLSCTIPSSTVNNFRYQAWSIPILLGDLPDASISSISGGF